MPRGTEHEPKVTWDRVHGWRRLEPPPEAIAESQLCEPMTFAEQRETGELIGAYMDALERFM